MNTYKNWVLISKNIQAPRRTKSQRRLESLSRTLLHVFSMAQTVSSQTQRSSLVAAAMAIPQHLLCRRRVAALRIIFLATRL